MSIEIARPAIPKRLANIPAFPPVAAKLLGLLAQEDADLGLAAELISTDPTFCARIPKIMKANGGATFCRIALARFVYWAT